MAMAAEIRLEGCMPCITRHRSLSFCFPVTMLPIRGVNCCAALLNQLPWFLERTALSLGGMEAEIWLEVCSPTHRKAARLLSVILRALVTCLTVSVCVLQHTSTARAGCINMFQTCCC
jgi:hypothetical protein